MFRELIASEADYKLCSLAAYEFKQGRYDIIKFTCFNEEEVEMLRKIMNLKYPEVKTTFTFLKFHGANNSMTVKQKT